jgi:uncharacterized protein (TIGR02231 family)
VNLTLEKEMEFTLYLNYQINHVSWKPVYDLRANFEKSNIELFIYGIIKQSTGFDWKNIKLTLSTSKPSIYGKRPDIESWFLRPFEPVYRYKEEMETPSVDITPLRESIRTKMEEDETYVNIEESEMNIVLHVPQRVNINSGEENKIPVLKNILECNFHYETYPRKSPYAYLTGHIKNDIGIPLLPGKMNIFVGTRYSGFSSLDYIADGEEFDIFLGIDENIKVTKELLGKYIDETLIGSLPSSKIKIKYEYKISLNNFKEQEIECYLYDNIPVAEDDRIQVNIESINIEPGIKDWEDKKGVWLWKLKLEQEEEMNIFMSYTITYPRNILIEGLID